MRKIYTGITVLFVTVIAALFVCGCSLFDGKKPTENSEYVHFSFTLPEGRFPDGSTEYTTDAPVGGKVTLPDNPGLDDYIFGGWVENGGYYPWDFETYVVRKENDDSTVYLVPRWIPTTEDKLVEFDGKSVSGSTIPIAVVDTDVDSYSFDGNVVCSTGSSWTVKYNGEVLGDKIIHGLESGDNYCTIFVRSPGGRRENQFNVIVHRSYNVTVSYCYDGEVLLRETAKTGYEYTVKDCEWVDISGYDAVGWRLDGQKVTSFVPMYDTSLFAIVDGKTYTVSFDCDGGISDVESKRVKYDETFTLPIAHREGYNLVGWYLGEHKCGAGGARYTFSDFEDVTLTAVWERRSFNIGVSAITAGGNVAGGGTYYYGDEVTVTAITEPGYTFMGWYNYGNSSHISDAVSLLPEYKFDANAAGIYLVAKWQKCGVSANVNIGGVILPETSAYGSEFTVKTTLSAACGLTFDGWYDRYSDELLCTDTEYTFILNTNYIFLTAKWSGIGLDDFEMESDDGINMKIVGLKNKNMVEVVIPDYITQIGDSEHNMSDLNNNNSFIRLTIGRNVKEIYNSFKSCYRLIEICNLSSELDLTDSDVAEYALNIVDDDSTKLDFGDSGYVFYADDDVTYLVGYTGENSNLTLPEAYNGKPYEIYNHAFDGSGLKSVEIAETTTGIGKRAFAACSALSNVIFNIGDFENSEHLSTVFADSGSLFGITVTFGADVETVPNYLLRGGNISTVKFADDSKITVIDRNMFVGTQISSLYIPRSVTEIEAYALEIPTLTYVAFLATNCNVAKNAFNNAGSSSDGFTLYIGKAITRLPDNMLYTDNAPNVSSLTFEYNSAIKTIGENAFRNTKIRSVTIPRTVTEIGENAFAGCTKLDSLSFYTVDCTVAQSAFSNTGTNIALHIGGDVERIPSWFNSLGITSVSFASNSKCTVIEEDAFRGKAIKSISLPNSITAIGDRAFYGGALTSVTLGSVVTIGERAFSGCDFTEIILPNTLTAIGDRAFSGCPLTGITFPNSLTTIGERAFSNCAFTEITLPSSAAIGQYAFLGCNGLSTVTIPVTLTEIGMSAFGSCGDLTVYYNAEDASADGNIFSDSTVTLYIGGTVRTINGGMFGSGVTKIYFYDGSGSLTLSDNAFDCTDMTALNIIGENITIGQNAFYNCSAIKTITYNAKNVTVPQGGAFAFTDSAKAKSVTIKISKDITSIPANLFHTTNGVIGKIASIEFERGSECESIGEYAFAGLGSISQDFEVLSTIASIGPYAFSGTYFSRVNFYAVNCADSEVAMFENCIIDIGSNIIRVPSHLASADTTRDLYLSGAVNLTTIGPYAFVGYRIGSIAALNRLTVLEPYAFAGMSISPNDISISEVSFNSLQSVGEYAFSDAYVYGVVMPNVSMLGSYAFSGCRGLRNCTLGGTFKSIPKGCFSNCIGLVSVTLDNGNSITSIGADAFYGCYKLGEFAVGNLVTSIGDNAFYGCSTLRECTMGSSVKTIGTNAFYGCSSIKVFTIGNNVTEIGANAFYDCAKLADVTFTMTNKDWKVKGDESDAGAVISRDDLTDTATAARYLTTDYADKTWTRVY